MCGITGIVSRNPEERSSIRRMTDLLAHRGPDGFGYYEDEAVALGHRRLSIIDLDGGAQPISNEDGTIQLVCNGEIYNSPSLRRELIARGHAFKTRSDVEVILHLYEEHGRDCVQHLRGMFAFAIWDGRSRELLLARDHLGQKPLFYWHRGDRLYFASEIKSIAHSGMVSRELDLESLWHYASLRFLPDELTLFRGIRKLPAATLLSFRDGRVSKSRYWNLSFADKDDLNESEQVDQLEQVLRETVRCHLLSDVRVGTFLSGGIDSTTVAALMAGESAGNVPSYSIGVVEQGFDELPYARMVAARYGFEAHEEIARANLVDLLPEMVYHMDEPADPYGVGLFLASRLAARTDKVVLSGDGADESFGGYDRYAGQRIVDYYALLPALVRRHLLGPVINHIPESFAYKSVAQKAAWVHDMAGYSSGSRYAQSLGFLRFTDARKRELFSPEAIAGINDTNSMAKVLVHYDADNARHPIDKMLYTDLMTRVPDHNLVMSDRMAMANSLEIRSPFMDHTLVEFAARIPAEMKVRRGRLKHILREVARRHLPEALVNRPKQGFGFPLGIWMRTALRGQLEAVSAESRLVQEGVFERRAVERLVHEHLSGKVDHNYRLWMLMNLEVWHRMHIDGEPGGAMHEGGAAGWAPAGRSIRPSAGVA